MNLYYAFALLISAGISAMVAMATWKRRAAPGAIGLMLFMFAGVIWAATYALRWMMAEPAAQLFWLDATYFGVAFYTTFLIIFALQFTGRSALLTRRNLALLTIVPLVTLVLLWTDNWHGLFFGGQHSTGTILSGGPWFWFFVVYVYLQILIIIGLFVQAYWRASSLYRMQTGAVLIGSCLPVAGNILSLAGFIPFPNLDITPFIFSISGLVYAYGLFGFRLLDVVPVARHKMVEEMLDGVIVLDANQRIVDINPAVQSLIGISASAIGQPSGDVLNAFLHLDQAGDPTAASLIELRVSENPPRDIELQVLPLLDHRQRLTGRLLILHDITARRQAEEALQKSGAELEFTNRQLEVSIGNANEMAAQALQAAEMIRESEARYRAVFDTANDAIIGADSAGNIVDWNFGAERIFGYSKSEACGQPITLLLLAHHQAGHLSGMERVRTGGEKHVIGKTVEMEGRRKDGSEFPLELSLSEWQVADQKFFAAVIRDITERKRLKEELQQQAATDELTGIYNRRYFQVLALGELKRANRLNRLLAIALIDIDHFKRVNDTLGHAAGDLVLLAFTKICQRNIREIDMFARFGGDEFALLLPEASYEQAYVVIERIRLAVEAQPIEIDGKFVSITISAGIANLSVDQEAFDQLLSQADQALYRAKEAGRNQVAGYDVGSGA
jgi:diguanylate cyclase (GGDEF)-like protein/PAS domain S-box-containing protein